YQLRRVEAETTCSERYGAMGVRGANRRANNPSTRPDHQCPARGRGPQCCIDAYKVRTRRGSGTAARWFLIRLLKTLLDRAIACELRRPGRVARYVRIHYITGDSAEPVMADNTHSDVKRLPFERAIEELESIVKRLEEGKVPLEESVAIYERGEALKRRCEELLRQAEARVEKITLDAAGKPTGTEPLDVT